MTLPGKASAHPRSRGENRTTARFAPSALGSSPLTRGKPRDASSAISAVRLIPAHAGKTATVHPFCASARAHPRSRGENDDGHLKIKRRHGSSPLTRGKPNDAGRPLLPTRLIPAHAGKTPRPNAHRLCKRAHPRSRGENRLGDPVEDLRLGSSPLTRGKPLQLQSTPHNRRLIPAHAGKTLLMAGRSQRDRAHPRSRGENLHRSRARPALGGSSPLTRGKPTEAAVTINGERLIPAHAGKTNAAHGIDSAREAHPRSRGENGG